ncbi:phage head completion protein [Mesorhizobium marinum]|uniref:Head-tail adaptor protein n=1 Tax=Mesorhizobium marinum TaxID=3228790 RepID=A0ABV3R686_9HYPH
MARAGARNRLITLSRDGVQTGTNDFNEPVYGPAVTFDRLASRHDVSDGEKVAAGQVGAFLMTRFAVLSDPETRAVTPAYRLSHDGAAYNILGVKETSEGRQRFIEITTVRDADS